MRFSYGRKIRSLFLGIIWTLNISELYEAGFETVILHKRVIICKCLGQRIFSKSPFKLHVLIYSFELEKAITVN